MKTICVATLLIMCIGLSSARTECTKSRGCVTYDNDGNGVRCGPEGCGPIGQGNFQDHAVRSRTSSRNDPAPSGGATACGIDGCKRFNDRGFGYGCSSQGCGPLDSNYQPIVRRERF